MAYNATMRSLKRDEQGVVSFIVVIVLAIILVTITVGFIRLAVKEQRQATDQDLSARALYAAEAGIDDAQRAIVKHQGDPTVNLDEAACGTADGGVPVLSPGTNLDVSYSCQLIDITPTTYQKSLSKDETVQIPLRSGDGSFNAVEISWHLRGGGSDDDGAYTRRTQNNWTNEADWATLRFPAALRMHLFSAQTGAVNRADLESNSYVGFLNPADSPTVGVSLADLVNSGTSQPIVRGSCEAAATGGYACRTTIYALNSGRDNFLRLKALYRDTHIQIRIGSFTPPTDSMISYDDLVRTQAIIDVTGRAGDVFRRVEARVSLIEDEDLNILPDAAILSNESICKNFYLTDDPTEFLTINTSLENAPNRTTCMPSRD